MVFPLSNRAAFALAGPRALRSRLTTGLPFSSALADYQAGAPTKLKGDTSPGHPGGFYGLYWPKTARRVSDTSPNVASSDNASRIG